MFDGKYGRNLPLPLPIGVRSAMRTLIALSGTAWMLGAALVAGQDSITDEPRGELLYTTYCVGCHTTQVHWREKRLATDWTTLKAQVRRWQANSGLGLGEDDITALARHLNGLYYHFPVAETKQSGEAGAQETMTIEPARKESGLAGFPSNTAPRW
jgi:mono/diheme cytochrome c family protein